MSLGLISYAHAMATDLTLPFAGTGGTPPYTYSVQAGGVGGTINPTTGVYTSPDVLGTDTVLVTDTIGDTASKDIKVLDAIGLFCDIIQTELDLEDDQIYLYNQKFNTPNDNRLYVSVGYLDNKPFGNNNTFLSDGTSLQTLNIRATLEINIFSRDSSARTRVYDLVMALNSNYSESQQELNCFRVFPISTHFRNLSFLDGSAIPYRYNLNVVVHYLLKKVSSVDYYNVFEDSEIITDS